MISKNGFLTGYDTRKRAKYSDETRLEIAKLYKDGLSIRRIGKQLDISHNSVYSILRADMQVWSDSTRPSVRHIKRGEAIYIYDIKSSSFDYYKGKCPDSFIKVGHTVYADRQIFEDYIIDKKQYEVIAPVGYMSQNEAEIFYGILSARFSRLNKKYPNEFIKQNNRLFGKEDFLSCL